MEARDLQETQLKGQTANESGLWSRATPGVAGLYPPQHSTCAEGMDVISTALPQERRGQRRPVPHKVRLCFEAVGELLAEPVIAPLAAGVSTCQQFNAIQESSFD